MEYRDLNCRVYQLLLQKEREQSQTIRQLLEEDEEADRQMIKAHEHELTVLRFNRNKAWAKELLQDVERVIDESKVTPERADTLEEIAVKLHQLILGV